MVRNLTVALLLLFSTVSFSQSTDEELIVGKWVSIDDSKWTIEFTSTIWLDLYDAVKIDSSAYYISNTTGCVEINYSSDTSIVYLNAGKFGNGETECFEITGLGKEFLAYRAIRTGRLFTFRRI